jgi:hypothetical protein
MADEPEDFEDLEEFEEPEDDEPQAPEPGSEEPLEDEEEIPDEPAPKPKSRAQARIEALDREAKEAKEAAEALRREVEELRNGRQRSDAEAQAARRRAELEAMDPWDRVRAEAADAEARLNNRLQAIDRKAADADDRAAFAEKCADNPALAKVRGEVEKRLAEARSRGVDVPRETLAIYILGEERMKTGPKAKARAEKKAAANLDRERGRPASGASEAPRSGGAKDEKAARLARLENYRF